MVKFTFMKITRNNVLRWLNEIKVDLGRKNL